eukprot:980645_1
MLVCRLLLLHTPLFCKLCDECNMRCEFARILIENVCDHLRLGCKQEKMRHLKSDRLAIIYMLLGDQSMPNMDDLPAFLIILATHICCDFHNDNRDLFGT